MFRVSGPKGQMTAARVNCVQVPCKKKIIYYIKFRFQPGRHPESIQIIFLKLATRLFRGACENWKLFVKAFAQKRRYSVPRKRAEGSDDCGEGQLCAGPLQKKNYILHKISISTRKTPRINTNNFLKTCNSFIPRGMRKLETIR